MTTDREFLPLYRDLAALQAASDRLRMATSRRTAYEELITRHDHLKDSATSGPELREFGMLREELAPYLDGRTPVPPPVDSADLIAYHRRGIALFGALAEAGVEDAAERLAAAETALAEELDKAPAAVELISFGYLHGPAPEAHLVVDMRKHFRDPHVHEGLRELTADNELVMRTVFNTPGVEALARATLAAVAALRAGPSAGPVRVAVGCAGGRHRSAAMVNYLAAHAQYGSDVKISHVHRDIHEPVVDR